VVEPQDNEQQQMNDARVLPLYYDTATRDKTTTNTGCLLLGIRNNMKELCYGLDVFSSNGR